MALDNRLGFNTTALGGSWLEAEAADHAGYVFEAPGIA